MATKSKKSVKKSSKSTVSTGEYRYSTTKKSVPENWSSRTRAVKACGRSGATITQVAKKMGIERDTATNLVRWLSWNGYLAKSERRVS